MQLQNKNAIFNILGPILLNGISFFTMPVFTRLLGPAQYGIVAVFNTWVGILSIIFGLQVQGSIGTAKAHLGDDSIKEYLSSILLLGLLFSACCIFIGIVGEPFFSQWMMVSKNIYYLLGIQSVSTFVISFSSIAFVFYKKAQSSFLVNITAAVSTAALSIALILYVFPPEQAYLGKILGMVIPNALIALVVASYFIKKGNFSFNRNYIIFCLPICLPLIFHGLSHIILGQSDRIMIQRMMSNQATGLYSFMIVFSNVLTAIWGALNNTWVPFYYDDLRAGKLDVIRRKSRHYIFIFSIIHIVFLLWAPEVIKLFAPSTFWGAIPLLPLFVMSNYFTFMYSFPVNFQFYHKSTVSIAIGTVAAALLNIGLNALWIPLFGLQGAAAATLVAHIGLFLFQEFISAHVLHQAYHYNLKFFLPGICIVGTASILFFMIDDFIWLRWVLGVVLSGVFFYNIYRRRSLF